MAHDWPPAFQIRRSQRAKRVLLGFHPQRGLEIVTPKPLSTAHALALLEQHRDWIEKHRQRLAPVPVRDGQCASNLPRTIALPAIDQQWTLAHVTTGHTRTTLRSVAPERRLDFYGSANELWPLLRRWLITQGKQHLLPRLHQLAQMQSDPLKGSNVRWNHSRWGSCSRDGRINLSARLLFLAPHEAHYVLQHELNHLHHFNHSPAFWQALEHRLPGARAIDRTLRRLHAHSNLPQWLSLL